MNVLKKYFITGVAGTGKTAISRELNNRGIHTIDFPAIPDLCHWRNKVTKRREDWSPGMSRQWLEAHERICDISKLKILLEQQRGNVVVTGVASGNIDDVAVLFDKIFLLQCNPKNLLDRLQTRESSWAKNPDEQDSTLEWQKDFDSHMLATGAIPIDVNGTLDETVKKLALEMGRGYEP